MPNRKKPIYMDYAATTPVDPRVFKAMEPYFAERFGNTMSLHSFGQDTKQILEESRLKVAGLIGADAKEVIFTGSATESNNLALKGVAWANREKGNHIIISSIEHPCVMETAKWLQRQGFEITALPVDKFGFINPLSIKKAIKKGTILVSVIHASHEIGTIQNIKEIGNICRARGVLLHTDATQSFGKIFIDVKKMNVDLLTANSHKIYGPKGAALLYIRDGVKVEPILHGGGQESGLRSSTVNIPAIVGFAKACEIYQKEGKAEKQKLIKLRDRLIKGILSKISGSYLNGHAEKRLPNNVNIRFDFVEGESITIQLDLHGIAASTGSACSSAKLEPSHVLLAIGLKHQQAHGSLRLTIGRFTEASDIEAVLNVLPGIVENLRKISPFKRNYRL